MWGDVTSSVQISATHANPITPAADGSFDALLATSEDMMIIGEVQVGVRSEHDLQCICARCFVQAAVEYQYWTADNTFATSGSFAENAGVIRIDSQATAGNAEIHLIGLSIAAGLTW